jgi:hypothetical protein
MPDQPKPHAYMTSLVFSNGQISQTALVALNFPNAVALCAFIAGRDPNITGDLTGCAALELTPEWLRRTLRLLEDGKSTGDVVSLVSDNLRPTATETRERSPLSDEDATAWQARCNEAAAATFKPALDRIAEMMPPPDHCPSHLRPIYGRYIPPEFCPSHVWQPLRGGVCPLCQPTLGGAA